MTIITFILGYLILLLAWFLLSLLLLAVSYVSKKNILVGSYFITTVLGVVISIGVVIWGIKLFFLFLAEKKWLLLGLFVLFGSWIVGAYQMFYGFLLAPFHYISNTFAQKAEKLLNEDTGVYEAEILTPEGKKVGETYSEGKINKELSTWLVVAFTIMLIRNILLGFPTDLPVVWIFLMQFAVVIIGSLVMSVFVAIGNLLRKKPVLGYDKKLFVAKSLRLYSIVYLILFLLELLWML